MKLLNFFKNNKVLTITILFLVAIGNAVFYFGYRKPQENLEKGIVINSSEITEDGGIFFQNLSVLNEQNETVVVRANLRNKDSDMINKGDKIILSKYVNTEGKNVYQYESILRTDPLFWVFLLFVIAIFITIGVEGIKYLFPFLFLLPFFLSSLFPHLLTGVNLYILGFLLLLIISFFTAYIRLEDFNLSVTITVSVFLTLCFVFFVNVILQKVSRIEDVYYSSPSDISFTEFRRAMSVSVLFISFGALINTSMEVCTSVKSRIEKTALDLTKVIRKGIELAQKTTGREINNIFFVLLGFSLIGFYSFAQNNNVFNLWNSAFIVQLVLYFLSASFAVIIIAPISSLVTAILLYKRKNNVRKRLYI